MKINKVTGIGKEICLSTFERTEIQVVIFNTGRDFAYIKKAFSSGIYSKEIVYLKCAKLLEALNRLTNLVHKYSELFNDDFKKLKVNIEKFNQEETLNRIIKTNLEIDALL